MPGRRPSVEELLQIARAVIARVAQPVRPTALPATKRYATTPFTGPVPRPNTTPLTPGEYERPAFQPKLLQEPKRTETLPTPPMLRPKLLTREPRVVGRARSYDPASGLDPTLEEPNRTIADAGAAMNSVLNRVFARNSPSKFIREPEVVGKSHPKARALSMEDLRHEASRRLLTDVQNKPNRAITDHIRDLEKGLGRWLEKRTATLSGIPYSVGEKRRLVQKAGTFRGHDPDSPRVKDAEAWLTRRGMLAAEQEVPADAIANRDVRSLAAPTKPSAKVADALKAVRRGIKDPNVLTEKQRKALALRFTGDMTLAEVAQALSVGKTPANARIEGGLKNLRRYLDRAGIKFEEPGQRQTVPFPPGTRTSRYRELPYVAGPKPAQEPPPERTTVPAKKTYRDWRAQYRNSPPTRLVPDPQGDIVIGNQRFRREAVTEPAPKTDKPRTKKKKGKS